MPEQPTRYLAERVVGTGLAEAPAEVIRIAKDTFFDTVGCMLAGAAEPGGRVVADFARRTGEGPASIVGFAARTSPYMAALANGTSAAILDYDDTSWRLIGHPSGTIVPAVLALGEERHASGRAVLEAYVIGFEVAAKIARGLMPGLHHHGRHSTGAIGVFGAAAACAKLLSLDVAPTAMAFGIAASCSGAIQGNWGSMTKGLHSGEAAGNGLLSACLASDGFTARPDILERKYGFAEASVLDGTYQLDEIGRDFAAPWDFVDPGVGIKLFPSGTVCFCAGECAIEIATRHALDPASIESVEWRMTGPGFGLSRFPLPDDPNEAFYSVPWAIAVGLVDRRIGLAQYSQERIRDPLAREICKKVQLSVHPDFITVADRKDAVAGELIVRLRDGRELRHFRRRPRAYPGGEPWTREQLLEKFREVAARVLPAARAAAAIAVFAEIESLGDICVFTEMLRPSP